MASKKRGSTKSIQSIHKHWYEKSVNSPQEVIDLIGEDSYIYIIEGEGCECYACGVKTKGLQRCHIVPHALGGSTDNDNMFLMCEECHSGNPDSVYTDLFYKYVKNKDSYINSTASKVFAIAEYLIAEATEDELKNFEINAKSDDLKRLMMTTEADKFSVGCFNHTSIATVVGRAWKNLIAEPSKHTEPALH